MKLTYLSNAILSLGGTFGIFLKNCCTNAHEKEKNDDEDEEEDVEEDKEEKENDDELETENN